MTRAALGIALGLVGVAVGVALAGCAFDPQAETPVGPLGDEATFARDVQPILERRCATLDCHGQPGRPLRLYSKWGLRLEDGLRPAAGTVADRIPEARADEIHANVGAIAGIDVGITSVDESLLLLKPLDPAAGGIHHAGRVHWRSTADPEYQTLRAWLAAR